MGWSLLTSQGKEMASRLTPAALNSRPAPWAPAKNPWACRRSALVKPITITAARHTAAEQTMQPASIKENSLRSDAACISCRAQATIATTASTIKAASRVEWDWSNPGTEQRCRRTVLRGL